MNLSQSSPSDLSLRETLLGLAGAAALTGVRPPPLNGEQKEEEEVLVGV